MPLRFWILKAVSLTQASLDCNYKRPLQFCVSEENISILYAYFRYCLLHKHVFIATILSLPSLFVVLLFTVIVDAFAAWQPNCTTPTQHVDYVSSPQVRGTMNIVWTCFAVLSLCTWTVQHLMVPVQKEYKKVSAIRKFRGKVSFNYTKLKWVGLTIAAPEHVLGKALSECLAAHGSRR